MSKYVSQITEYVPRAALFAPPEVMSVKVSPDSKYLAYVKGEPTGVMNIFICAVNECSHDSPLKQLTYFTTPEIYRFFWTGDSRHVIFLHDTNGSKTYHLYSVDIESGVLRNHTKDFNEVATKVFQVAEHKVAVGINDRNPDYHDIFILDLRNESLTRIFKNDRYSRFTLNGQLEVVFKEEIHEDGSIDIYKNEKVYIHLSPDDAFHSRILEAKNSIFYYLDSRNSDTTRFKSVDLGTGKENQLAHDSKSDIDDIVFVDDQPYMFSTTWLRKEWHSFGSGNFDFLQKKVGSSFEIISQSKDLWIVRVSEPKRIGASFYLYNRSNDQLKSLFVAKTHPLLNEMIPFEFESRDGLRLTAYITLPDQITSIDSIQKPVPLVVFPHGGPFQVRNRWTFDPEVQWLASRGYAVLQVNFRLSSGLGKDLVNAGNGEWGRKALFDLLDGVKWCVDQGITTKAQVGIMGGSYGGYATLAALAFTPNEFAVGVADVAPSSLITLMQNLPQYWDFPAYSLSDSEIFGTRGAFVKSIGGDPNDPDGKMFLASRSPLNFSNQITSPLLLVHGDNDPIVTKEESLQIFNELKRLKKKTCLLSFSDEGHRFTRYANIDVSLAYAEKWLHDSLGGRYEPIDPDFMAKSSVSIQE